MSTIQAQMRDFEQTIAYYRLPEAAREWMGTTSWLERTTSQLRHKFRPVSSFGSQVGAQIALFLQVKRLHAHWSKQQWGESSPSLSLQFRHLNP